MITVMVAVAVAAVALTPDLQRRHERVLRNAIAKSGQTVQQAAMEADIDQGQFTRQLQLAEGSHKRLAMQPIAFMQWLAVEITREFGLPAEIETGAALGKAVRS
jgi:hypothetical protein